MLAKIIDYTLHRKGMVLCAAFLLLVIGGYSYVTLPIDAFPDVTNIQVEIVSHADGINSEIAVETPPGVMRPRRFAMARSDGMIRCSTMRAASCAGATATP